ncbi:MAG: hypothetical protein SFW08_05950 [Gemmatimonadaceae bacterium]|nr:hypothetical protein [Gemmatimonadaceae bacterium]
MIGCLVRTAVLGVVLGAVAWMARDRWWPRVFGSPVRPTADLGAWTPVGDSAAARGRAAATRLTKRGGPAFVTLDGGEAAALAIAPLQAQLPSGMRDVAVRVRAETLDVRAVVRPAEFGGREVLGAVYGMLPERDTVQIAGLLEGDSPGFARFRVQSVRFHDIRLPARAVAPLLRQLTRGATRPSGLPDDAVPVPLPPGVGDLRVRDGNVTLYRAVP